MAARAHFVKRARKSYPDHGIKKGESYYWWKFRYGGKRFSKTPPKPSQLINSPFLSEVASIEEELGELNPDDMNADDVRDAIENAKGWLEDLQSETEDKLNNMPESLQQGPTGELLQGRVDSLGDMISELEGVECEEGEEGNSGVSDAVDALQQISYGGE